MKFLLVLTVCSAVAEVCLPPGEMWPLYDSHYDCATAGYLNSMGLMREFGETKVNDDKIMVAFKCVEVSTEAVHHYRYSQ